MANSLAHSKWVCKYHVVFTPKYRRKIDYWGMREDIRDIIRDLCKWKGVAIIEGKVMPDHIHLPSFFILLSNIYCSPTDLHTLFPSIAAQWYREKNGPLTPETVSPYSNRRVWWRCDMGHPYQAVVAARTTHGSGCPYCANRKVLPGFNDLATTEPKVAAQWHPTLNGALTPEMVTAGSHRKVWWECPDGHIWKAVIYSRAGPQKTGCPVCAGRIQPARMERYQRMAETGRTPLG